MPQYHSQSEFGFGPRACLDREQRARFKALLSFHRLRGRVTLAAEKIGRVLADMLAENGQLDPSTQTLAARARVHPSTVTRAKQRLRELGFITWVRRLVREGWRTEQTSNAYVLLLPSPAMCNSRMESLVIESKKARRACEPSICRQDEEARANAQRQLALIATMRSEHLNKSRQTALLGREY